MSTLFQVGDKAVYPAQGVAEVVGIDTKVIMGTSHTFYVLRVMERKMLDTAKRLLVQEIAVAKDMTEDDVMDEIEHLFTA